MAADPRPALGRRIREQRERNGLTQHTLAAKLGISYQLVQHYEHGEKLSLDRLIEIARALDCEMEWLLTGIARERRAVPKQLLAWMFALQVAHDLRPLFWLSDSLLLLAAMF